MPEASLGKRIVGQVLGPTRLRRSLRAGWIVPAGRNVKRSSLIRKRSVRPLRDWSVNAFRQTALRSSVSAIRNGVMVVPMFLIPERQSPVSTRSSWISAPSSLTALTFKGLYKADMKSDQPWSVSRKFSGPSCARFSTSPLGGPGESVPTVSRPRRRPKTTLHNPELGMTFQRYCVP